MSWPRVWLLVAAACLTGCEPAPAAPTGPPIDTAVVRRALDYWTSVLGVEFVMVSSLVDPPRLFIHPGAPPVGFGALASLGLCDAENWTTGAAIMIRPGKRSDSLHRHEIGHVLGYWLHSSDGLMSADITSDDLTPRERQMMVAVYSLPAGTSVQADGAYVTGSGEAGQLVDTQAAADIVEHNLPTGPFGSGCRFGVTKRWRSPVRVYVQPE